MLMFVAVGAGFGVAEAVVSPQAYVPGVSLARAHHHKPAPISTSRVAAQGRTDVFAQNRRVHRLSAPSDVIEDLGADAPVCPYRRGHASPRFSTLAVTLEQNPLSQRERDQPLGTEIRDQG